MGVLGKFRIRTLLGAGVGLLAMTLLVNIGWQVATIYLPQAEQSKNLKRANQLSDYLLAAAAEEAKERGVTATFLGGIAAGRRDPNLLNSIRGLRTAGDQALDKAVPLAAELAAENWGGPRFRAEYQNLLTRRDAVTEIRERINESRPGGSAVSAKEWIDAITRLIGAGAKLRVAAFAPNSDSQAIVFDNVGIKQALWTASEYAGRERAILGNVIGRGEALPAETLTTLQSYRSLVDRQLTYLEEVAIPLVVENSPAASRLQQAWSDVERVFLGSYQTLREKVYAAGDSGAYPVDGEQWLDKATEAINTLLAVNGAVTEDAAFHAESAGSQAKLALSAAGVIMAFAALLTLVVLGIVVYVSHRIAEPERMLKRMGEENDMSLRLDEDGRDEFSSMARAFNSMLGKLNEFTAEVIRAISRVGQATERVIDVSEKAERGIDKQRSEVAQVAAAMNEMAATVQEVAGNTARAASAGDSADKEANNGRAVVDQTIESINGLVRQVEETAAVISQLESQSMEINRVLEVINEVAEQTNLLALNAAIEAARAGEHGRGFAVVADEVRGLASRTQKSTEEIRAMIEQLQEQSNRAAVVMSEGQEKAESTIGRTGEAAKALKRIVRGVATIRDMSGQIATATEEQSQVAENMNSSITRVAAVADSTTESALATVKATDSITEEMRKLRTLVARFRGGDAGLDLSAARAAHRVWKTKLRDYMDDKITLDPNQLASHHDCVLGKWYYGEGLEKYGDIPEMKAVEKPHAEMHQLIKDLVAHHRSGESEQAEALYARVEEYSDEIVHYLQKIEQTAADREK